MKAASGMLVVLSLLILDQVAQPTPAQAQCVAQPSCMISWYRMEGTASDEYGANHPSATNNLSFVAGEVGQGVSVGSGGFIDIANSASLAQQRITLDAWARPNGPGPNNDAAGSIIVGKNIDANDVAVQIAWSAQSGGFFRFNFFGGSIVSPGTFPAGVFYHVAGTYDGAAYRLYVNGVLQGSAAVVHRRRRRPSTDRRRRARRACFATRSGCRRNTNTHRRRHSPAARSTRRSTRSSPSTSSAG